MICCCLCGAYGHSSGKCPWKEHAIAQRIVVCAANKWGDVIVLGARHFDSLMHSQIKRLPSLPASPADWEQGFVDQHGVFMDRRQALQVAISAGQVERYRPKTNPEYLLFSEDLY